MEPRSRSFQNLGPEGFHRVRYWEWGPANSERTVVCVHGLTRNGRDFDDLAKAMAAKGWRVAAPDVVGRGESDWLIGQEGYDFAQYVADMSLLIARLGGGPVAWVGTSMGGIIGQMLAAGRDAPVSAMVLNDIGPFLDKAGLVRIKGYVGKDPSYADFAEAKAAIDAVTDKFGPMDADQRRRFVEVAIRERPNGAITMKYDPKIAWSFQAAEPEDVDLWPMWGLIQCPVLVLRGAESDLLSAATAKRMQAEGPKAEEYVVEGVGHAPALMSGPEIDRIMTFLEFEPMSAYSDKTFKALAGGRYIDIAYRQWGAADNPKVAVCCHGLSRNRKDFDDLAAALAKDWRVYSVDMPGRGDSDWLDDKGLYGYPLYEQICAGMIAVTGAETVTWIGTSMGGILGMRLASKPGAPIDRLVLNDIGPFIPAAGRRDNQANFGKDPRYASAAEAIAHVKATRSAFGPFSDKDWDKFGRDSLRQLDDGQWTLHYDPGLASNGPIADTEMWALWPLIHAPVLTVWGTDSKLLTAVTVDRMARTGPRSEVFAVPGVGHCPGLTQPDQIQAIAEFIGR